MFTPKSKARIKLTTHDIAAKVGLQEDTIRHHICSGKLNLSANDPWTRFWALVEYLEETGLRPPGEAGALAEA